MTNTKQPSTRTTNTQAKKTAFMKALVTEYGEGAVVTRKQILAVHAKNPDAYPHPVVRLGWRVERNKFLVTLSADPQSLREQTLANTQKLKDKKAQTMLKSDVRNSPAKLMKEVMGSEVPEVSDDNDINGLLKTISN